MPGRTNWTRMTQLGWRVRFKYVSLPLPLHVVLSIACISPPCPLSRCKETPVDPTWVGESIPPSERKSSPATSVMVIQPTNFLRHFQESGIPPATDIPRAPAAKSPSQLEQLTAPASAVSFSAESPSQPEKTSKPCGSAASDAVAEGTAVPASSSETGGQGTIQFPASSAVFLGNLSCLASAPLSRTAPEVGAGTVLRNRLRARV